MSRAERCAFTEPGEGAPLPFPPPRLTYNNLLITSISISPPPGRLSLTIPRFLDGILLRMIIICFFFFYTYRLYPSGIVSLHEKVGAKLGYSCSFFFILTHPPYIMCSMKAFVLWDSEVVVFFSCKNFCESDVELASLG